MFVGVLRFLSFIGHGQKKKLFFFFEFPREINKMDFYKFYDAGAKVILPQDMSRSSILARLFKETGKKTPWNVLQVLALKHCYLQLFPYPQEKPIHCVNDTLLDFDSVSDYTVENLIVVESRRGSTFCFSLQEILSIFHSDLSRSVLEYEPQYHILTLTKAFRLPTHPYLQETFTAEDIRQIIQQMVLKFDTLPLQYPEVYVFLRNAFSVLEQCQKKSNYDITTCLETYFESQKSTFKQKYTVKTRENQSYWDTQFPKQVKDEKQVYLWFLQTMFPSSS